MMKNKKIIYGILLFFIIFVSVFAFALYNNYNSERQDETNQVVAVAKGHLQKYVHNAFPDIDFFSQVKRVEITDGECEANNYWKNWGSPPAESPAQYRCWIVKFYYHGPSEGSHLAVYVDKNTNKVIGGAQTK